VTESRGLAAARAAPLARLAAGAAARSLVLGTAVAAALYLISAPLLMLLVTAFRGPAELLPFEPGARWSLEHLFAVYRDPILYGSIVPDTLVFTVGSVALSFLIAFPLAWLVERTDLPARELFFTLILFPLLVPSLVLAIAWIFLLGPNAGWLNLLLRSGLGLSGPGPLNIFSMPGLVVAQAVASVPFVFLLLSAALRSMDPALEEAARVAGARPLTTFRRVTLPVLRPGVLAPLVLATIITLEQFEMPLLIGLPARVNVFSTRIFWELNPTSGLPNYGRAATVALPFLLLGVLLLGLYNRLIRGAERFVTITGRGYRPRRLPLGRWRWPAVALAGLYVTVGSALPAGVLLWASLFGYSTPSLAALPGLSLAAYARLLGAPILYLAIRNTLLAAGLSAALVTVLGALVAWILVRTRARGRGVLDFVSFMSVGIPSVIAALAVMLLYLTVPVPVYGTVWILVLAYSYRLAVTTRISRAGLMQIHRELEEASDAAGATWLTTLRRVALPLLAPSLVGAWVLLFVVGVREFTLAMVLGSPDNVVLSVIMWRLFSTGETAQAAALAVLVLVLVIPVIFLVRRTLLPRLGAA
jgi:iron(III) transport system permease protein